MTKRERLEIKIEKNNSRIAELSKANLELLKETLLLSDKKQWFTEGEEESVVCRRPKKTEKYLVGRIHWNEGFMDEDTNEVVWIERSKIVRVNGIWQ